MKPKNMVAIKSESEYIKENKMVINKTQKRMMTGVEGLPRGTVLVNNGLIQQRGVINNNNNNNNNNRIIQQDVRCKRKIAFVSGQAYPGAQPASVARRNARERNRVKQVNNGFATLRSHIPASIAAALSTEKPSSRNASNKKLSKVETLKMAVEYIRSLQRMLEDSTGGSEPYHNENYEEDYYSSSPDGSHSVSQPEALHSDYYQRYAKSEPDEYYSKNYLKSEPEEYDYNDSPQHSPLLESPKQFRQYDKNPNGSITLVNSTSPYSTHIFVQPRQLHSTSLSPPISEACPSPTPSYASDNSSVHTGSIVSSSSGQVAAAFSRLSTNYVPENYPSPVIKSHHSPIRQSSPNSLVSSTVASSSSPSYNSVDLQKQQRSPECDNYEPMSPEDEELLDVISWWQQTN